MIRLKDAYWHPVEKILSGFLWEQIFSPMFEAMNEPKPRENIGNDAILSALRAGTLKYDSGVFSGTYNVKLTMELSKFASWDGRSKTWVGMPSPEVIAEAQRLKWETQRLNERISTMIAKFQVNIDKALKNLRFPMVPVLSDMNDEAIDELKGIAVMPELTDAIAAKLEKDYTLNQQLNIKNWAPEQIERLRAMIQEAVIRGYNIQELRQAIINEWGVSANKARFLARQETSLFVSGFRDERYQSAGVEEYIWMSSHDSRCREANKYGGPAHGPGGPLHGHRFRFDNPPRSGTRGEPGNPGTAFGCRCIARPILPKS